MLNSNIHKKSEPRNIYKSSEGKNKARSDNWASVTSSGFIPITISGYNLPERVRDALFD